MTLGDRSSTARECSSCGGLSDTAERFCWRCGEKLPQRRLGPLLPITIGAIFVLLFAGLAVFLNEKSATEDLPGTEQAISSTTTFETTTTALRQPEVRTLSIDRVTCTGQLATHPCEFAVDGDASTAWNAPGSGIGAEIVVGLAESGRVTRLIITNHTEDEDLLRNARIARLIIHFADSTEEVDVLLEGWHGPYSIPIPLVETTALTLHIEDVHPAESYGGSPPFDELALAEIRVVGVPLDLSR